MNKPLLSPRIRILSLALTATLLLAISAAALAAPSGYTLAWSAFTPGGSVQASSYTLNASIAQPLAGSQSAGSYTLSLNFWSALRNLFLVNLPLVKR